MSVGYFSRGECPSAYDFINYGSMPDKKSTTSVMDFNLAADAEYIDVLIFGESIHNQRFRVVQLTLRPFDYYDEPAAESVKGLVILQKEGFDPFMQADVCLNGKQVSKLQKTKQQKMDLSYSTIGCIRACVIKVDRGMFSLVRDCTKFTLEIEITSIGEFISSGVNQGLQ